MSRGKTHLAKPRKVVTYVDGVLTPGYNPLTGKTKALCNARVAQRRIADRPTCEACRRKNKAHGWKALRRQLAMDIIVGEIGEEGLTFLRAHAEAVKQDMYNQMQRQFIYGNYSSLGTL